MPSLVAQRVQSLERQPSLLRQISNPTRPTSLKMSENESLTDSQKLDRLLAGFDNLQTQYNDIKADHEILREECKSLRNENKRLKEALLSMSKGSGNDYLKCEDLLQEIVDLKEMIENGRDELEDYKRMLEESNANLQIAMDGLRSERAKKCTCFICRLIKWAGLKK